MSAAPSRASNGVGFSRTFHDQPSMADRGAMIGVGHRAAHGFCPAYPAPRRVLLWKVSIRGKILLIMFTPMPIGFVSSPYTKTGEVPKGLGTKHEAEGTLEILPEFGLGLTDIEGFSHLIVLWAFDRSQGFELLGTPPSDDRPHGVFATRSPRRPNPIGLTVVEFLRRDRLLLYVRGVDMLDRTPILDIKPYLSGVPQERLRRGWLAEAEARKNK